MGTQCRNRRLLGLHGYSSETCWYLSLLFNHFLCFLALTFFWLSLHHYSLSLRGDYVWFWGLIRKFFSASYEAMNFCIITVHWKERLPWLRFTCEYKHKHWEAILMFCRFSWTKVFSFRLRVYITPHEVFCLLVCFLFVLLARKLWFLIIF